MSSTCIFCFALFPLLLMSHLPARLGCTLCPPNGTSKCASWVARDINPLTGRPYPRAIANNPNEHCAVPCGHAWISHRPIPLLDSTDPAYDFQRGPCPESNCGGFYSNLRPLDLRTLCVCGFPFMSHPQELEEERRPAVQYASTLLLDYAKPIRSAPPAVTPLQPLPLAFSEPPVNALKRRTRVQP
ncbi:hypothetical protein C8F04DRAFT_1187506 [Mycena alexandri]|uniref:Secreted protein n=1 Tax=Mycena alexandri TaxID=1745969 RepID=A0AAD6S888_9AGAR|nr:hypothetical protein C8F04DRAFT_1194321 [Mycena alexandri]KAJ7029657.1 hypothetical protein C8F04DRAFT_1187506 [Mycena alexandri]